MKPLITLLAVSDTHGNTPCLCDLVDQIGPVADLIIHAGDGESDCDLLLGWCDQPIIRVAGNGDRLSSAPRIQELTLSGQRILICHGDQFAVKQGLDRLVRFAQTENFQLVIYGHTHQAAVTVHEGVTLVNPGTLALDNPRHSYALITISQEAIDATILPIS